MSLTNQVPPQSLAALVTGACGGIGRGTSERLAQDGWRLVVTDLDAANAEALAAELPGTGHCGLACNVAEETSVDQLFNTISDRYGLVDGLVTAAGILRLREGGARTPLA